MILCLSEFPKPETSGQPGFFLWIFCALIAHINPTKVPWVLPTDVQHPLGCSQIQARAKYGGTKNNFTCGWQWFTNKTCKHRVTVSENVVYPILKAWIIRIRMLDHWMFGEVFLLKVVLCHLFVSVQDLGALWISCEESTSCDPIHLITLGGDPKFSGQQTYYVSFSLLCG